MALANKHLPISTLRRLGWKDSNDNGTLLDSAAIAVFRCLEDAGVKTTGALRPGPMKMGYHDTWMTADCVEILFSLICLTSRVSHRCYLIVTMKAVALVGTGTCAFYSSSDMVQNK